MRKWKKDDVVFVPLYGFWETSSRVYKVIVRRWLPEEKLYEAYSKTLDTMYFRPRFMFKTKAEAERVLKTPTWIKNFG